MTDRVLIIDDDPHVLSSFRRQLSERFSIETALGGDKGIEAVLAAVQHADPFAVVVSDMRMPGLDGIETLTRIREIAPETVRMMLTGNAEQQTAVDAINEGHIFRFYSKPTSAEYLAAGLTAGIEQFKLVVAERELLEQTLTGSINLLCDIMTMNDPLAARLSARLRDYVRRLTIEFKMPQRWPLEIAATLSPLSNAVIPSEVSAKMRAGIPLDKMERSIVDDVPHTVRRLIANIPRLGKVAEILYLQDRGFDGSGLPADGPSGTAIPLDARLLRILRDLALIVDQTNLPNAAAFAEMAKRGSVYDPQLLAKVRACLEKDAAPLASDRKKIPLSELAAGDVLASDVKLAHGHLILVAGTPIGVPQLERLRTLRRIFSFIEPIEILAAPAAGDKSAG